MVMEQIVKISLRSNLTFNLSSTDIHNFSSSTHFYLLVFQIQILSQMEEEKEHYQKDVYTTFIFCNILPIDNQHVWFIIDRWDAILEFENIHEVASYWSVLPSNMHGLNSITDSVDKLTAFCITCNESIDISIVPRLAIGKHEIVKTW